MLLQTLQSIFTAGYGRFLVYENDRSNIKAVVVTKDLLAVEPDDEVPLRTFCGLFGKPVVNVSEMTHLDKVSLLEFLSRETFAHGHLAQHTSRRDHFGALQKFMLFLNRRVNSLFLC